ncbi:bifunctional adenosylcobinamide kinase/adenosylcobinamide-phosphate guanylyltransferase [Parahaliea mediterranea]|uniref:bifunctional adenosylcobinamide kinase/adenosylcobinamide-phosphate guanylyltransferase n=1 Tax=Parahaliea mediterranea TaxID=651086 RepID=UPI000E2F5AEC|nr:bifunctional adenosylcobinamide kinase/adenosylcobinamide-phosphate guanylyltransferase [Parahaliea mediterranea]
MMQLILGGARSGKSRHAEACATASGKQVHYIATAAAGDAEMARRIAHHQTRRDPLWQLHEEPLALHRVLQAHNRPGHCLLVDCLTLWLSNCLGADCWEQERDRLLAVLDTLQADLILVSNEVGSGIVPLGELSRRFVDEAGWLHQRLASRCQRVSLVCAGLPLVLKDDPTPNNESPP